MSAFHLKLHLSPSAPVLYSKATFMIVAAVTAVVRGTRLLILVVLEPWGWVKVGVGLSFELLEGLMMAVSGGWA